MTDQAPTPTLEEFFEMTTHRIRLVKHLEFNFDNYCDWLKPNQRESFLRMNLTVIRQCLEAEQGMFYAE